MTVLFAGLSIALPQVRVASEPLYPGDMVQQCLRAHTHNARSQKDSLDSGSADTPGGERSNLAVAEALSGSCRPAESSRLYVFPLMLDWLVVPCFILVIFATTSNSERGYH